MDFSCYDSVSVSSMKRNNENLTILGCFVSIDLNSSWNWNVPLETLIFDRNLLGVLVQPPVLGIHTHGRLCISISRPAVGIWTNPLEVRPIGKRFKTIYR